MTAGEMIEELSKLPPHAPVMARVEQWVGGGCLSPSGEIVAPVRVVTASVDAVRWQGSHVELSSV